MTVTRERVEHEHLASTIVTMQLGLSLLLLLGLMFFSGGLFYLYVFNYNIGPYFTITRVIHFYAGLASIPFLVAKYGSTSLRFASYYLHLPRFKRMGPPNPVNRILSPVLVLDFFVLYFSGLYMLFHYYYTVTNIPPGGLKPVQLHLWAAVLAVPLLAVHLGWHLFEAVRGLAQERHELRMEGRRSPESNLRLLSRRAFVGTVFAGGLGLAYAFQNTPLRSKSFHGLWISRIPKEERGGPGGFPSETLFGQTKVDRTAWRLRVDGAVAHELSLSYDQLLALPSITRQIRLSCVSGWTDNETWTGPRVRDVLALAGLDKQAQSFTFHSLTNYGWTWQRGPLEGDDAMLATHVNGKPISEAHGFPLRLILSGYPGQNMIKQLDRISVGREAEKLAPDFKLVGRERSPSSCHPLEA
ncbi:MAG: molybdopterin-dependent oxidoreductase [Dehalococcoidia bacterium]